MTRTRTRTRASCADTVPSARAFIECLSCGRSNRAAANYCDCCGTPLGITPRPVRKTVTVVFGDLVGSTALQENLDPEPVAVLMARYYEIMRRTVREHGGRLEKFVGDGVVAVFGADQVREDDALRATRCAASMVVAVGAIWTDRQWAWDVRLQMRVGVHTGELVVGEGRELVGDTMNTAARLEQAAAPDEVLIGEATRQLVHHQVVLEPISPLTVRGKATPLSAWRLVSPEPEPGPGPDDVAETQLIGRTDELDRLLAAVDAVAATGHPRLITVIGPPGMGKSRLLREFVDTVSARTRAADVGMGSFYNHFETKEELFGAAVEEAMERHADLLDALTTEAEDPAEMFARSFRLTGRLHRHYPELSRVLLSRGAATIVADRGLAPRALRDITAGNACGRFTVHDPELALVAAGGALLGLLQLLVSRPERDPADAADQLAEDLLRMFGVPTDEAHEICTRPLPDLAGLGEEAEARHAATG